MLSPSAIGSSVDTSGSEPHGARTLARKQCEPDRQIEDDADDGGGDGGERAREARHVARKRSM